MRDYDQSTDKVWKQDHRRQGGDFRFFDDYRRTKYCPEWRYGMMPKQTCNGVFQIYGIAQHVGSG